MPPSFIKNCLIISGLLTLTSCTKHDLSLQEDSLTKHPYYMASFGKLRPLKNCQEASLKLKCLEGDLSSSRPLKFILTILDWHKKDYKINFHEMLTLIMNGKRYPLEIVNSFKKPGTIFHQRNAGLVRFYTAEDFTERKISFLVPASMLEKMTQADTLYLEISPTGDSKIFQNYPISLEIEKEDISFLKNVQETCIKKFPRS